MPHNANVSLSRARPSEYRRTFLAAAEVKVATLRHANSNLPSYLPPHLARRRFKECGVGTVREEWDQVAEWGRGVVPQALCCMAAPLHRQSVRSFAAARTQRACQPLVAAVADTAGD